MVSVRLSSIHGLGLFASQPIAQGTVIGKIIGSPVSEDGPYVLWLTENTGLRVENEMKYINHSPAPNAAYFDDGEVIALCAIDADEEITHDYSGDGLDWDN